jgi:hypothetical protein
MLMKTSIKITALAVLAAFAVFSCGPSAELSEVDWAGVGSKHNSGDNTDYYNNLDTLLRGFGVTGELTTGENETNEVTIRFPASSDFLRAGNITSELRKFLSFHHFTKAVDFTGKADTLGDALPYNLVKHVGNDITVKLTKTFVATDSNVIMKIDGAKYTFAGGNKMDLVGKGRSGQSGYDDLFRVLTVYTVFGPSEFTGPRWENRYDYLASSYVYQGLGLNRGWNLSIGSIPVIQSGEIEASDYPVATLSLAGLSGLPEAVSAIAETVANQLKSGLRIQKFADGSWDNADATFTYDQQTREFTVNNFTFEDLLPYRVAWEGRAPVTTAAEYFGVKQYIAITGKNTPDLTSWNPALYLTGKVYGEIGGWYNTDNRRFNAEDNIVDTFISKDLHHKNIVIELVFNSVISGDPSTTHWLKDFNNDGEKFKDNFKVAYYNTPGAVTVNNISYPAVADNFTRRPDVVYITIKDVEYFSYNPSDGEDVGLNAIRITLDPAHWDTKKIYFYISPEIGYDDGKTTFGDPANYLHGFFKAYEVAGHTPYIPYLRLYANAWANGYIATPSENQWFSFTATASTQYIHFDNSGSLNDVYVQLYDRNGNTVGVEANLYGSTLYMLRTVTPGEIYSIRVRPYGSGSGNYRIAFNASVTRP